MLSHSNIAVVASLIGDPSRVEILMSLIGGKALTASELARSARITPQTASSHLAKMVGGGLLTLESNGRHRYYRLAGPEVAHALESLQIIAKPKLVRSLRESEQMKALRFARTCYDHLAGQVGVTLTDRMVELKLIGVPESGKDFILHAEGKEKMRLLGVDMEENGGKRRRHFARQCLDWSERRQHLAGHLGAALTARLFQLEWIERIPSDRAVRVTSAGITGLMDHFGLKFLGP